MLRLRGGFVNRMRRDVDDTTLQMADIIVCNSKEQEKLDHPAVLWEPEPALNCRHREKAKLRRDAEASLTRLSTRPERQHEQTFGQTLARGHASAPARRTSDGFQKSFILSGKKNAETAQFNNTHR
jgi:hypothetical protein